MADESQHLVKFLSTTDFQKYINDPEVRDAAKKLQARVTHLSGGKAEVQEEAEENVDISGATRVKLVVVGDGAVGKTSLLISYATGEFPSEYVPTVFENYTARKKRVEASILLHLWDTAGQEEYDRLRPLSYPGADIVLLCFSTVSQASYDAIKDKWAPEVKHYIPDVPHILVVTKTDLRAEKVPDPNSGVFDPVSNEKGIEMAKLIGAAKYLECSAKTTEGLDRVFEQAIDLVLASRNPSPGNEHVTPVVKQKSRCILL